MTDDDRSTHPPRVPFIVRFADPLPDVPVHTFRYDPQRQVSQVFVNGHWLESPEAYLETQSDTRYTKVGGETTDDQ